MHALLQRGINVNTGNTKYVVKHSRSAAQEQIITMLIDVGCTQLVQHKSTTKHTHVKSIEPTNQQLVNKTQHNKQLSQRKSMNSTATKRQIWQVKT